MLYSFFLSYEGKSPGRQLWIWNMFTKKQISCAKNDNWITKFKKIS